jgi:hypothetical protein
MYHIGLIGVTNLAIVKVAATWHKTRNPELELITVMLAQIASQIPPE